MSIADFIFGVGAFFAGVAFFWLGVKAYAAMRRQRDYNAKLEAHIARLKREQAQINGNNFFL